MKYAHEKFDFDTIIDFIEIKFENRRERRNKTSCMSDVRWKIIYENLSQFQVLWMFSL